MPPKRIAPTFIPMPTNVAVAPSTKFGKFMQTVPAGAAPAVPEAAFGRARNPREGTSLAMEEMLIEAVVPTRAAVLAPSPSPRQKLMWVKGVLPLLKSIGAWLSTAGRRSAKADKAAKAEKVIASLQSLTMAQVGTMSVKTIADRMALLGVVLAKLAPVVTDAEQKRYFNNYAAYLTELKHMLKTGQSRPLPYEDAYGGADEGGEGDDDDGEASDAEASEAEGAMDDFVVSDDEGSVAIGANSVLAPVERLTAAYERALDRGQRPTEAQKEALLAALDRAIVYFENSEERADKKLKRELEGVAVWVRSDPQPEKVKPRAKAKSVKEAKPRAKPEKSKAKPKPAKAKAKPVKSTKKPQTAKEALQPVLDTLEKHVIPNKMAKLGRDTAEAKKWQRYFRQFTGGLRAVMDNPGALSDAGMRKDLATALRKERAAFSGSFNMHEVELVSRLDAALQWLAGAQPQAEKPQAVQKPTAEKPHAEKPQAVQNPQAEKPQAKATKAKKAVAEEEAGMLPSPSDKLPRRQRRVIRSLKRMGVTEERGTCPFGSPPQGKVCVRGYWKRK